jgi:hypothetical protein
MNLSRIDASGTKIFDRKKNKRVDFQKKKSSYSKTRIPFGIVYLYAQL